MNAASKNSIFAQARDSDFVFSPVHGRKRAKSFELVPVHQACISMGMKIAEPTHNIIADEAALIGWFETAGLGERCTYHIGQLAADRARDTSQLPRDAREALGRVADRVMALATDNLVIAVQQRLDDGRTAYLAIKSGPRAVRFADPHQSRGR